MNRRSRHSHTADTPVAATSAKSRLHLTPRLAACSLLGISIFLPHAISGEDRKCEPTTLLTNVGERYAYSASMPDGERVLPLDHRGSRYLRAKFRVTEAPPCDWSLTVRDEKFRPLQVFSSTTTKLNEPAWTGRVRGEELNFDATPCADGRVPRVELLSYVQMPADATNPFYSLPDDKRYQFAPIYSDSRNDPNSGVRRLGDNTGMLMGSYDRTVWVCSGVMLTDSLFLTNWHCGGTAEETLWRKDIVEDMLIDLSFDGYGESREYAGVEKVAGSERLDYAIIRVRRMHGKGGLPKINLSASVPQVSKSIWIPQHPAGRIKQVSSCVVEATNVDWPGIDAGATFTYQCGTEKGSSGAPVFDSSGSLIGIHHLGFAYNTICVPLDNVNKAIQFKFIGQHIRLSTPSIASELGL